MRSGFHVITKISNRTIARKHFSPVFVPVLAPVPESYPCPHSCPCPVLSTVPAVLLENFYCNPPSMYPGLLLDYYVCSYSRPYPVLSPHHHPLIEPSCRNPYCTCIVICIWVRPVLVLVLRKCAAEKMP